MRTYLNHPGKCHLARGVGSSVNTYNTVMKKSFTPGCRTPSAKKVITKNNNKNKK
jgi:hypothetical protein